MRLALRHGLSTCISSRVHVQIHVVHDRGIAIYMKAYAVHVSPLPTHTHTQLPTDRVNPNVIESTPTTPQVAHLYYANTPTAHHRQAMKADANAYLHVHIPPGTTSVMNSTHRMQLPQPQASSHGFTPPN